MPLVGRDRELAELVAAFERLPSGSGSLVLLAGEPGIGKTRLALEAAEAARARGVRRAWGRCWESGGAPAFWPWTEVFGALGLTFPKAGAITATDPAEARFALFRAVAAELGRAATDAAILIVLEDLHAADHSTLLLLEFVADFLRNARLVVIGTYRDLEARLTPHCAESLARLGRSGRILQLPRLAAPDVAALVRAGLENAEDRLVATVFEMTQGNPLFIDEVVRDIRAHGERRGLPLGVREVIRQRLAPLSPAARAALEACAVLGVEVSARSVERMVAAAAPSLDDATTRGILVARGDRLRFAHALYREALYDELAPDRRRALHREAARALADAGAPLAEVAHHFLEAGPEATAEATDHAVRAALQAADTFAFEDALALLERARAAMPAGVGARALRFRVDLALGETKIRSGDASGRNDCVQAAHTARALGDPALLALAGLAYGTVFLMGGVDPVLVSMLEEALAGLPSADSSLRARVMARLAAARQPSSPEHRPRDEELGLAAIEMARRVAEPRDLLGVLNSASGVLYGRAHPTVRLPIAREQERLAEQLGDTTRLLQARVRLANDHMELMDFAAYGAVASSYDELARRIGAPAAPWRVPLMRSALAIARDDFAESERQQEEARRLDDGQPRARRAIAFHRLGFLRAAERHADVRAALAELRGLWMAMPYGATLADAHVAAVLAHLGEDEEVAALAARLPGEAIDEEINATSLAAMVWAAPDVGFAARVDPLLDHLGDRWHVYWFDCEHTDGPTARARAWVSAALGRWAECDRLFATACTQAAAIGRRTLVARMKFEMGDLLARLGREPDRARELRDAARAEAEAARLPELVALIDRRHPASSARPPRAVSAFTMKLEGEYYAVTGTQGTLRFKASRGMHYLAALVERPDADVHVLDLVGSSAHADRGDAGELADPEALGAYRTRLDALREVVETAEELGDAQRAERARHEMEKIAAELSRTTGKGGRARRAESAVDRARSAVQRRIKDAIDRIGQQDPRLGNHLRRAVRTGNTCSYRP